MRILVTGGFGFIGSHLAARLMLDNEVHILDCETYASNREGFNRLRPPESIVFSYNDDLRVSWRVPEIIKKGQFDVIYHLAAESHVCNSIDGPQIFFETNVMGTFNLLEAVRLYSPHTRFIHVSTDEVFGDLSKKPHETLFNTNSTIEPLSPYAASKASSDHIALSYAHTYGLNITVTNCSNNYGPNQHEEKLIPATIKRLLEGKRIRLYGDGQQKRDWLWVGDHVSALMCVASKGEAGRRYVIGGDCVLSNFDVTSKVAEIMIRFGLISQEALKFEHTNDRPTDDQMYAVDTDEMKRLGFTPSDSLAYLPETIAYYVQHEDWRQDESHQVAP